MVLVAVIRDANSPNQFHREKGPARISRAGVEHLGNVGMIHHGQRLPLGLEPGDHLLGVHAQLDDLERHTPADRLGLLRDIDYTTTTFTDPLQQLVPSEGLAHRFVRCVVKIELDRRLQTGRGGSQQLTRLVVRRE